MAEDERADMTPTHSQIEEAYEDFDTNRAVFISEMGVVRWKAIADTIKAVLSAPTVQWCTFHDEPKDMRFGGSGHVVDDDCEWQTVALVPAEDGE